MNSREKMDCIFDNGRHDIMDWAMNLPPSDEPGRKRSFEIFIKLDKPGMTKIFKLKEEDFIPGIHIIMIGKTNIIIFKRFGRKRRETPFILMNKVTNIKMVIEQFCLRRIFDWTYSDGFCFDEDIQIISLIFERVERQEVPINTKVFSCYDSRCFEMNKTLFNVEQVYGIFVVIGGRPIIWAVIKC